MKKSAESFRSERTFLCIEYIHQNNKKFKIKIPNQQAQQKHLPPSVHGIFRCTGEFFIEFSFSYLACESSASSLKLHFGY